MHVIADRMRQSGRGYHGGGGTKRQGNARSNNELLILKQIRWEVVEAKTVMEKRRSSTEEGPRTRRN